MQPALVNEIHSTLQAPDYIVFTLFLLVSLGIGLYYAIAGDRQRTAKEFLTGNRNLSVLPVAVSILVSFTSAILILGSPAEVYLNGTMYFYYTVAQMVSVTIAIFTFMPMFYPLKITSSFEYLEARFESRTVRIMGNILFILAAIVYMGFAMFAPSSAMAFCSNGAFSVYLSIAASGLVGTAYTMLGGIKAVVWTDVFQSGIMLLGLLAIIIKGTIDVGGPGEVWRLNEKYGRIQFDEFNPDPRVRHSFWSLVVGGSFAWLNTYGVHQATVQRYISLPSLRAARRSLIMNLPGAVLITCPAAAAGMVIFAYYHSIGCDIHDALWAPGKNEIVPYYVMDRLAGVPCLAGLFIASLFSGALSTVSSLINSCAAIAWKDIIEPSMSGTVSDVTAGKITKGLTLLFGLIGTAFGFLAANLRGTILQASHSFTSALGSPSLGIFLLGAVFPFSNKFGAVVGAATGLSMNLWLSIGSYTAGNPDVSLPGNITMCNITDLHSTSPDYATTPAPQLSTGLANFYKISYLWFFGFGVTVTVLTGLLVSIITNLIFGCKYAKSEHLLPFVRYFYRRNEPSQISMTEKASKRSAKVTPQHDDDDDDVGGDDDVEQDKEKASQSASSEM